jgi:hypothetical protein
MAEGLREFENYIKSLGAFPYRKVNLKDNLGRERGLTVDYTFFHPKHAIDIALDIRKPIKTWKKKVLEENNYQYHQLSPEDIKQGKFKELF